MLVITRYHQQKKSSHWLIGLQDLERLSPQIRRHLEAHPLRDFDRHRRTVGMVTVVFVGQNGWRIQVEMPSIGISKSKKSLIFLKFW
jgi:hypothetical protein